MIGDNGGFVAWLRQGGCQTELRCGSPPARLHVLAVHWGRPKTEPPPSRFKWALPVCSSIATLINSLIAGERQCNPGQMHATQSRIHIRAKVKSTEGQRKLTLLENQPMQLEQRSILTVMLGRRREMRVMWCYARWGNLFALDFPLVQCYQLWKHPVQLHSTAICPSNVNHREWMGIQNRTKHPSRGRACRGGLQAFWEASNRLVTQN